MTERRASCSYKRLSSDRLSRYCPYLLCCSPLDVYSTGLLLLAHRIADFHCEGSFLPSFLSPFLSSFLNLVLALVFSFISVVVSALAQAADFINDTGLRRPRSRVAAFSPRRVGTSCFICFYLGVSVYLFIGAQAIIEDRDARSIGQS